MIPRSSLARLAERASDLFERSSAPFIPVPVDEAMVRHRLQRWAQLGALGEVDRLRRTLAARSIDLDAMGPALTGARLHDTAPLPAWVERFASLMTAAHDAVEAYRRDPAGVDLRFIDPSAPLDFEMVVAPLVLSARRRVPDDAIADVGTAALGSMERILMARLSLLCGPVLQTELRAFALDQPLDSDGALARRFAATFWSAPLPAIFNEYPVLARLVTLVCDHWVEAMVEMLTRITADRMALAGVFNHGQPVGRLTNIELGDADMHDGHRTVAILTFDSGCRVVYKPRSLEIDQAFAAFVAEVNEAAAGEVLRAPAVCCGDGYGYAEFIQAQPAADDTSLALFYHRMGALAAVTATLGSTDLHCGNVIASAGTPVAIDLETILSAELRLVQPSSAGTALPPATAVPNVVQTMLLPLWNEVRGIVMDRSAVAPGADGAPVPAISLPCAASDLEAVLRRHGHHLVEGFEQTYRHLSAAGHTLCDRSAFRMFGCASIRCVVRETSLYFTILRQSVDPACLRDGADRAIALERLNHVAAAAPDATLASLVNHERTCLLALDIPRFMMPCATADLTNGHSVILPNIAAVSPLERAARRLTSLDTADCSRQARYVAASIAARLAPAPARAPHTVPDARPSVSTDELIARAVAIAERLPDTITGASIAGREGLAFLPQRKRWVWTVGNFGLGSGSAGDALLFAALAESTNQERWRERALQYARHAAEWAAAMLSATGVRPYMPWLGVESGVGGQLCALALLARSLGPAVVSAALVDALAHYSPAAKSRTDLAGGVAGMLLGLKLLDRELGDARLGAAATCCEMFLASSAQPRPTPEAPFDPPLSVEATAALRQPVDRARVATLRNAGLPALDSYRFGTAGEVDALLWLGQRGERADGVDVAAQRMAAAVARADRIGWRLLPDEADSSLVIDGLFDGAPGVAYAMLRLAAPNTVPSLAAALVGEVDR